MLNALVVLSHELCVRDYWSTAPQIKVILTRQSMFLPFYMSSIVFLGLELKCLLEKQP